MKLSKKLFSLCLFGATAILGLVGCGPTEAEKPNNMVDYVHDGTVKLAHDYKDASGKNRDFFTDGISQVTLYTSIDGDTSHFKMKDSSSSDLIKSRYYGIDTPESTGSIEPYGKAASNFTHEKLDAAKTIVVTSTDLNEYKAPETDSTGTRYLSMVWINLEKENAPYTELYLLNLWIVQEGFSNAKNVDAFPTFKETFYAAEAQAKELKLNMFSGKDDPLFNYGDYQDVSLLDLKKEIIKNLQDETYQNKFENAKVRIQGTVAGYTNNILYLQGAFDTDGDEVIDTYAGINIFTGMSSIPSKYTIPNTYIQLCGVSSTSENFGFQVSGVYSFPKASPKNENDTKVIYTAAQIEDDYKIHTFKDTASALDSKNDYLFSPVEVTDVLTVTGGYTSASTPAEVTLYCTAGSSAPFSIYVPFLYHPIPGDDITTYKKYEDYVGQKFLAKGIYSFHKTTSGKITYQIVLRDSADLVKQA